MTATYVVRPTWIDLYSTGAPDHVLAQQRELREAAKRAAEARARESAHTPQQRPVCSYLQEQRKQVIVNVERALTLRKQGLTIKAVAQEMGVVESAVFNYMRGGSRGLESMPERIRSLAAEVRAMQEEATAERQRARPERARAAKRARNARLKAKRTGGAA